MHAIPPSADRCGRHVTLNLLFRCLAARATQPQASPRLRWQTADMLTLTLDDYQGPFERAASRRISKHTPLLTSRQLEQSSTGHEVRAKAGDVPNGSAPTRSADR